MTGDRRYDRTEEEKAICKSGCKYLKTCQRGGVLGYDSNCMRCTVNMPNIVYISKEDK